MQYRLISSASDTGLVGYVTATYDELVNDLGDPSVKRSGDDKVTVEWILKFIDGTIVTIYDWKTGQTPRGEYRWHVGGRSIRALERLRETLYPSIAETIVSAYS